MSNITNNSISKTSEKPRHSHAIFGIRGVVVVAILAHHYFPMDYFSYNVAKTFTYLLIAIAGYFFAGLLLRNQALLDAPSFPSRAKASANLFRYHFVRTVPLIAFVILLYVLLGMVDGGKLTTQIFDSWWMYVAGFGNVPKFLWGAEAFPSHFWAVAAQDQSFVLLALLMALMGFSKFHSALPWIIAAGMLIRIVGLFFFMPDDPALALETPFAVIDILAMAIWTRLAVERPEMRGIVRRYLMTAGLLLTLLWAIAPNTNVSFYGLTPVIITALAMWLMLSVSDEKRSSDWQVSLLNSASLVFMGRIALCVFLLNPLVGTVLNLMWPIYFNALLPWWLLAILGSILSIALAWLLHISLERPLLRWRSAKRHAPPAPPATPAAA